MSQPQIDPPLTSMGDPHGLTRQRALALGAFGIAVVALVVTVVASLNTGSDGTSVPVSHQTKAKVVHKAGQPPAAAPIPPPSLTVARVASLPAPVASAAGTATTSGAALVVGGLDSSGFSVSTLYRIEGTQVHQGGSLGNALHGAAATSLGASVYLFGGGRTSANSAILRVGADGTTTTVGQLPSPAFDSSVATIGGTAYIVGGFTGKISLSTIVAWKPNSTAQVVANLPSSLRYAAVASVGGHLIIAGGTVHGGPSRAIYSFDPAGAAVTRIGWLPRPLTRSAAGVLGGKIYVIGGRGTPRTSQSQAIYAIDPTSGAVTRAALLPVGISDTAVASLTDRIIVAGGSGRTGTLQGVWSITPK